VVSPARLAIFDILCQVDRGGYASDLLFARSAALDSRDAGLAAEVTLGVLRFRSQLDFLMERYSGRPAERLDPEVRIALRMGIYQARYLERVPPHAAIHESVELVKRARKRSAAGFVNAVLRKVDRAPVDWPSREIELAHPQWLLERWDRQFGRETANLIARANLQRPETYRRGTRIQDIGSQSIVPLLELSPGQTFLDLCAAPGNKTAQALETGVRAVACDLHWSRLAPMKSLGVDLVLLDAREPLPFSRRFDRILVDAPCAGTGTLAHNPEIKWRLRPEAFGELQQLQKRILGRAIEALAPGGRLVYSTCSLEREENEDVVEGLAVTTVRRTPGLEPGDGFFAAIIESETAKPVAAR
jgi:16S rRNA (cytosine967-C5)-methyltransferase